MTDKSSVPIDKPNESLGRTIAKNALAVTFGNMLLKAINFLYNVYVARGLGGSQFGEFSTVGAFVGVFQIVAEFGISQYVMREIARDRSKTSFYFWNLMTLRVLLAVLGIVFITLGAAAFGYPNDIVLGVFILTGTFLLAAIQVPLETVLIAHERLSQVATLAIVGQVSYIVLGTLALLNGAGFVTLLAMGPLAMLPHIALALWLVRREKFVDAPWRVHPNLWLGFIRGGVPFGLIVFTLSIAFSIDTVILSRLQPEYEVGWYRVVYNLTRSLLFFFTGFSEALVPSLSRVFVHDVAEVERWYHRSIKFIALTALPVALGGAIVAFPLIELLYTREYLPSALVLQIIIWDVPVLMFASFCGNMTTIIGAERSAARIYGLSAIGNVLLNLYAIPRFSLLGAAVVTVATDLMAALCFYLLLRRHFRLPNMTSLYVRTLLASAVMGGVVYWAMQQQVHVLGLMMLGVVIYGLMVLVLRLLNEEEWALLRRVVRLPRSA